MAGGDKEDKLPEHDNATDAEREEDQPIDASGDQADPPAARMTVERDGEVSSTLLFPYQTFTSMDALNGAVDKQLRLRKPEEPTDE